jgi:hypothetical protein
MRIAAFCLNHLDAIRGANGAARDSDGNSHLPWLFV